MEKITVSQLKKEGKYKAFTADEKRWLDDLAAKQGQRVSYSEAITYVTRQKPDGGEERVPKPTKSEFAYKAYTYCAVYDLYVSKGLKLLLDDQGVYRIMPQEVYDTDPTAFYAERYDRYTRKGVVGDVLAYVVTRWDAPKVTAKVVSLALEELAYQQALVWCDPVWRCVQLTAKQIEAGELAPISLSEVYKDLSEGFDDPEDVEPYRWRALTYMIKAPIVYRLREHEAGELVEGVETYQAIPILKGRPGLGKSTLTRKMSMGWASEIEKIQDEGQRNIFLRSTYWILENAELSGTTKGDIEALKNAITKPYSTYNPKYLNGLRRLPNRALIIGTTNSDEILKDYSGERRFWPVELTSYDQETLTYGYFARAYATEYLRLKQELLKNAQENPTDEKARKAGAQRILSLLLEESDEDRAYKHSHYSQPDPSISYVKQYLVNLFMTGAVIEKGSPYLGVVQHSDGNMVVALGSQRALSTDFDRWLKDQHPEARVYTGKVNQLLTSFSPLNRSLKKNGTVYRTRQIELSAIAESLGLKATAIIDSSDRLEDLPFNPK